MVMHADKFRGTEVLESNLLKNYDDVNLKIAEIKINSGKFDLYLGGNSYYICSLITVN